MGYSDLFIGQECGESQLLAGPVYLDNITGVPEGWWQGHWVPIFPMGVTQKTEYCEVEEA
jgi:hypothetical protein